MRRILLSLSVVLMMGISAAWAQGGGKGCCGACCAGAGGGCGVAAADGRAESTAARTDTGVAASRNDHEAMFSLLTQHAELSRKVEILPNGVRTVTTTKDPKLVPVLRAHVRAMEKRVEEGRPIRLWDPVFQGIFANAESISIEPREIENGIEVLETSADPAVVELIQAHAAKVNSFVADGHAAARPPWAGPGAGRTRMGPGRGQGRGAGPPR